MILFIMHHISGIYFHSEVHKIQHQYHVYYKKSI